MKCTNHPSIETVVSCSACGKPICPDCMVYTPVGAKCPDCGRMPKSATIRLKPDRLLLTAVIGLVTAVVGGYIFGMFLSTISFLAVIIAFAMGSGIGEAVSRASGRYRVTPVAAWAAVCAVLGVLFPFIIWGVGAYGLSGQVVSYILTAAGIWKLIWMAAAAYAAWQRAG